jgi:hypothetical protein
MPSITLAAQASSHAQLRHGASLTVSVDEVVEITTIFLSLRPL